MSLSNPSSAHYSTTPSRLPRGPQATADERRQVVAQWRRSGLGIRAFGRQVGMHPSTLSNWIRKYLMESSAENAEHDDSISGGSFIAAVPPTSATAPASTAVLVWHLPADLGLVQGDAGSLGSLLASTLRELQR